MNLIQCVPSRMRRLPSHFGHLWTVVGFLDHILPSLSSVEAQFESLIIDPYLLGTRLSFNPHWPQIKGGLLASNFYSVDLDVQHYFGWQLNLRDLFVQNIAILGA